VKYTISISSFVDDGFIVSQFSTEGEILLERIIFSDSSYDIDESNYNIFHDDSVCLNTLFIKKNEIINTFKYGMNMRRVICL